MKEPRAIIMPDWIELIDNIVPNKEERYDVLKYICAEYMRIGYGVAHELTKPDGVGGKVAQSILAQVERMCSRYAEIDEKRRQNLTKANEVRTAQTNRIPTAEWIDEKTDSICKRFTKR